MRYLGTQHIHNNAQKTRVNKITKTSTLTTIWCKNKLKLFSSTVNLSVQRKSVHRQEQNPQLPGKYFIDNHRAPKKKQSESSRAEGYLITWHWTSQWISHPLFFHVHNHYETCSCVCLWTAKVRAWQNPFPQVTHLKGFSFEWIYLWSLRWSWRLKAFPQMSHGKGLSSVCVLSWIRRL